MNQMIYNFVQSLTMREKAYFKRFARIYSEHKEPNYIRLYSFLERQEVFNPKSLQKAFSEESMGKYLSSEQHYLLEQILNSLIHFHFDSSHHRRILKLILYVDLLTERGFRKKAQKMLHQAKTLAYKYEEFSLILKLIQMEEEILFSHGVLNFTKQLQLLREERKLVSEKIQNYNDLRLYREQVRELQFTAGFVDDPSKYPEIFDNALLDEESSALSISAKENWHYIQGLKYYLLRQFSQSQKANKRYLAFFDEHAYLFKTSKKLPLLSNLMYQSALIHDKEWYRIADQQLELLKKEKELDQLYILYIQYARRFEWCYQKRDIPRCIELIEEVGAFIKTKSDLMGSAESDYLTRLIIRACIITQNWILVSQWVQWWYKIRKSSHGLPTIRLFTLMAYYQLGYKQLLESEVLSTYKILRQNRQLNQLERSLLTFFKGASRVFDQPQKLRLLVAQLVPILKEIKSRPAENHAFVFFDFVEWAQQLN